MTSHPLLSRLHTSGQGDRGLVACPAIARDAACAVALVLLLASGKVLAQAPVPAPAAAAPSPAPVRAVATRSTNRSGDFIVAVVNTELVTAVEVNQRIERAQAEARRSGAAVPAAESLRQQALDALIDERVQITHARDSGYKVEEADVDRAVTNVAGQNQLTVPQLRERLRSEGMDFPRFRSNLRDQLMVERVREREVLGRIRVADDEIDKMLDEQRAKRGVDTQLNLAQILVSVPEGATAEVVAQRQARAEAALAKLRSGASFSEVAREFSEDGNREAGGEIGLRPVSRLPDLFVESVKDLAVGATTAKAVRSPAGFHVLKVLDRQESSGFKATQTRARHILLRVSDGAQTNAVARRLEDLRRQIERGERKFEDQAKAVSEDGSAAAGGDLGWAAPGQFVPEFEEAMNKLQPGGISPPVVSRFGVHLIQVMERRDVQVDPKELREQARNQLREQKFEPAYLDWVKELRLRAYVELREPPL